VGVNGSGKTSVLWAIVIALRCFNLRFHDSKWGKQPYAEIQGKDLSKLINAPHLQSASWKYISRQGASASTEIDSIINERSEAFGYRRKRRKSASPSGGGEYLPVANGRARPRSHTDISGRQHPKALRQAGQGQARVNSCTELLLC
jgi:hypothetical protein